MEIILKSLILFEVMTSENLLFKVPPNMCKKNLSTFTLQIKVLLNKVKLIKV